MATSNRIRALNRLPFDFQDGLKVGGVDVTNLNQAFTPAGAGLIGFTPVGNLAAGNVQAALAELDSEKVGFARLDDTDGSSLVGYDGGTVQDVLDAVTGPAGAASVGYRPAGTGAVDTTVESKLREFVSVKDFGAVGDGVTDDTAAIQAAIDTGKDVIFPDASYKIAAPLQVGSQRLKGGVGIKWTNRAQSALLISGNHAAFINKAGFPSFEIDGFYVRYGTVTPTDAGTSSEKIAFKFTANGASWPEYIRVKNCTVQGAWYGYYDDTGTYLSKLTQIACRNTRTGFYKTLGTTIEFDSCSSSDGIQGFNIFSVLSATLLNCAADALTIDNTTPNLSGNAFRFIPGLTITGWDGEYNTITNKSAALSPELIPSYMRFHNTSATVTGIATLQNSLVSSQANTGVTFFMVGDNSTVQFSGFDINKEASDLTFTGSLCPVYTVYAANTSKTTIIGCDVAAPSGGTPTTRYSLFGTLSAYISVLNSIYNNSTANLNLVVNQDALTAIKIAGTSVKVSGTNNSAIVGTETNLGLGQAYGGFGGEAATFQKDGNTALFSVTSASGSGVPASFARGNSGALQYFFKNGTAVGHIDVTSSGVQYFLDSSVFIMSGSGSPEGSLAAPMGSLYMRTDGGAGTTMYVKESGVGNTGWVAK